VSRRRSAPQPIAVQGDLVVERDPRRSSGRLLRQGEMDASYVDLSDPGHLEFDYLRWFRIVLRGAGAHRVLHIGGGACALARALAADDPQGRQEVCEVDANVLEMARRHLGLRRVPGLRVRHAEGRAALRARAGAGFDAVAIDAFVGARVPAGLTTAEAMSDAAAVAALTVVNVVDDRRGEEITAVAAALRDAYPRVWALGGRVGNTLVAGDHGGVELTAIAARAAADPSPARLIAPAAMARRLITSVARRDPASLSS
jgi:hypothetical protein